MSVQSWNKIVLEELNKKHIGDIKAKEILFLCSLGRLIKNKKPYSFNQIIHSSSSAGKDHIVKSVLDLLKKEDVESFGRLSAKALNYLHTKDKEPNWTYDGKILYLEEIEENVLNTEVMKVFTAGNNRVAITQDKGRGAMILEVQGKPVVFVTTATTTPTEEIMNRFGIVKLDESEEQTRRTFEAEEQEYSNDIKESLANLESFEIEIPFKDNIAKVFPANKVRARRDFQRFLDWIKAVAIFNQRERIKICPGVIRAELEDYEIAKEIYSNAYCGIADFPLKKVDKRIVEALEQSPEPLSAKDLVKQMKGYISIAGIYPHLKNLVNKEVLQTFEDRDSFCSPVTKYALSEEFKDKEPIKLPNVDAL